MGRYGTLWTAEVMASGANDVPGLQSLGPGFLSQAKAAGMVVSSLETLMPLES